MTVRGKRYTFWFEAAGYHSPAVLGVAIRPARAVDRRSLETAGYSDSVNTLAKAFSKRSDWRDFIEEKHGLCWFSI